MTYLRLNKIRIYQKGKIVYQGDFPNKINIIRGENSTGKSTLANFIYYILGGDFIEWLPEARSCDFVFGEIEIDSKVITLKREVVDKIMQPMQIYYGAIDSALKSAAEGWQVFPYRKSDSKESFSQLLFQILKFPEVTTENNESITMSQILRLMYIDQMSPLINFIKNVDFDSPLIRQAIGNLMLGIYDDKLFNQQIELRNKKRRYGELKSEFQAVRQVYSLSNQTIDINQIDKQIIDNENDIKKIDDTLAKRELIVESEKKNDVLNRIKELRSLVEEDSRIISTLLSNENKLVADIIDSKNFIDELQNQSKALSESLSTRTIMGNLEINFCPSCLSPLGDSKDDHVCHLCKKELNDSDHKSRILRIQHEINTQIKESQYLLERKQSSLDEISEKTKAARAKLSIDNRNLNTYINSANATVDRKQDELLIRKGALNNENLNLVKQKQLIVSFLNLKTSLDRLEKEISNLEEAIKNKQSNQRSKLIQALDKIGHYSLILLKGDGNYEASFLNASRIEIDFSKNLYYVDERNNFSASSLVILKNSIRFGIFFASLDVEFMRYPRFILCDNIEDKGMTEERSHNFQKNLVAMAEKIQKDYQIIFTTSMIDSSLEIEKYTIGEHYFPDKKSLKF